MMNKENEWMSKEKDEPHKWMNVQVYECVVKCDKYR